MSWTCHRLRAALVDFADGSIDERAGASVERHLAQCDDCSAAVLELREVPTDLRRRLAAEPPEEFWTEQRASILHAVDGLAPASAPPPARERKFVRWTALGSLAAAAAASFLFVRLRSAPAPGSLPNVASRQAVNVATETARESSTSALVEAATSDPWAVDDGSLLSLADELESQAPVTSEEGLI
jgi:anti-sigma factor RsiW